MNDEHIREMRRLLKLQGELQQWVTRVERYKAEIAAGYLIEGRFFDEAEGNMRDITNRISCGAS